MTGLPDRAEVPATTELSVRAEVPVVTGLSGQAEAPDRTGLRDRAEVPVVNGLPSRAEASDLSGLPGRASSFGTADRGHERRDRLAGLLARAQVGERAAWDALVAELTPMLWHTARGQGLGYESAQDVVQTTWLVLVRRQHSINTPGALIEWLVTTARREAWRARARERSADLLGEDALDEVRDPVPLPEELLLADERQRALWRAVGSLSRRCQVLLRVIAFAPQPHYDAVARALDMPKGSIGPTRGRCLAKLRQTLTTDPAWNPDWRAP
ncbi:hypothetical protein Acor_22560 [Acrocarpospora corrugata]|uniref:RNA polymerase sigma-70 region 2 domain-containing protein n=1 Tax=Acrocarpospora corrugata TaxID=35763 RepID=A0A5M3VYM9_9ACTN|nr:sigma-70 family RNA polymerase sigma factor [Acrocarpospora corrugata]GES00193.1 hypothetical protein Acor_22560 [Acrocarpospora corrugata]